MRGRISTLAHYMRRGLTQSEAGLRAWDYTSACQARKHDHSLFLAQSLIGDSGRSESFKVCEEIIQVLFTSVGLPVGRIVVLSLEGVFLRNEYFAPLWLNWSSGSLETLFGFFQVELAISGNVVFLLRVVVIIVVVVAGLTEQRVEGVEAGHDLLHVHIELVRLVIVVLRTARTATKIFVVLGNGLLEFSLNEVLPVFVENFLTFDLIHVSKCTFIGFKFVDYRCKFDNESHLAITYRARFVKSEVGGGGKIHQGLSHFAVAQNLKL